MNEKIYFAPVSLGDRSYRVSVGIDLLSQEQATQELKRFVAERKVMVVCDSNTRAYAQSAMEALQRASASSVVLCEFPAGESSKTLEMAGMICEACVKIGLDRDSLLVGFGGGVTGDLTAFAASIYMRGIECVQMPTSLLAMIDSSVGGKTGVDIPAGKNLIGTFFQPKAVLADVSLLKTLPQRELSCGFAELIKHAILFDPDLFETLRKRADDLLSLRDLPLMASLIARSCEWKASVVSEDEKEHGRRALLNLGHSFGHAVEKLQNFGGFSHGEAVAFGIAVACDVSVRMGLMSQEDAERCVELLRLYRLPAKVSGLKPADILAAMGSDKKNRRGKLRIVLPLRIGEAATREDPDRTVLLDALGKRCND